MKRPQDIELKLLRVFRAIVDAGGITNAQTLLNTSQSTLSTQLSDLEARLGFRVCQRGRQGFALTDAGRDLLAAMDDFFAAADLFQHEVANISGELRGVLRIGTMDAMLQNLAWPLAEVIGGFSKKVSTASVDLALVAPAQVEEALIRGRRDCVIGPFPEKLSSLDYLPLYQERNSLYAHRDHRAAHETITSFDALSQHETLMTAQEWRHFPLMRPAPLGRDGLRPTPSMEQMETHMILICTGRFIGFLPDYLAQSRPELVRVRSSIDLQYLSPIYMAFRKGAQSRIILQKFIDHARMQDLVECELTRSGAVQPLRQ